MGSINVVQGSDKWQAFVKVVMKFWVLCTSNARNFLASRGNISSSRRILLHGVNLVKGAVVGHTYSINTCSICFVFGRYCTLSWAGRSVALNIFCVDSVSPSEKFGDDALKWIISKLTSVIRLKLKCDGTRWRAGGEVNGKLANGVGSRYPSHYLRTWCIHHYYRWCARLGCQ